MKPSTTVWSVSPRRKPNRITSYNVCYTKLLRQQVVDALQKVDLLLLPTTPMKAPRLPGADVDPATSLRLAFAPVTNTMPFDNTHHPAMSVPCGLSDGLPVGMMLVGRHFEEATIYRAAHAFESAVDWRGS